MKMKDHQVFC